MTEINFLDWMKILFILSLLDERPVLLIIDGHKTQVLKFAVAKLQNYQLNQHTYYSPLDVSVFRPLKEAYDKEAHNLFLSQRHYHRYTT